VDQEEAVQFARKYLEDILSFFGVNIVVNVTVEDEVIELTVPSTDESSVLIGRNGETLRALQYMVSTALRNKEAELVRVNVDIADYKKQRAEKLAEKARGWIEEVRSTGNSHVANLNAADRRVVHRVVAEYDDVQSFSEGEGRDRTITIAQKSS
jgi:spoIIIJ-associated protein